MTKSFIILTLLIYELTGNVGYSIKNGLKNDGANGSVYAMQAYPNSRRDSDQNPTQSTWVNDIPEAPAIPRIKYETFPAYLRQLISTERPNFIGKRNQHRDNAKIDNKKNKVTNRGSPSITHEEKTMEERMKQIEDDLKPFDDTNEQHSKEKKGKYGPITYGMSLSNGGGHVWNDFSSKTRVSYDANEPRKHEQSDMDGSVNYKIKYNKFKDSTKVIPLMYVMNSNLLRRHDKNKRPSSSVEVDMKNKDQMENKKDKKSKPTTLDKQDEDIEKKPQKKKNKKKKPPSSNKDDRNKENKNKDDKNKENKNKPLSVDKVDTNVVTSEKNNSVITNSTDKVISNIGGGNTHTNVIIYCPDKNIENITQGSKPLAEKDVVIIKPEYENKEEENHGEEVANQTEEASSTSIEKDVSSRENKTQLETQITDSSQVTTSATSESEESNSNSDSIEYVNGKPEQETVEESYNNNSDETENESESADEEESDERDNNKTSDEKQGQDKEEGDNKENETENESESADEEDDDDEKESDERDNNKTSDEKQGQDKEEGDKKGDNEQGQTMAETSTQAQSPSQSTSELIQEFSDKENGDSCKCKHEHTGSHEYNYLNVNYISHRHSGHHKRPCKSKKPKTLRNLFFSRLI